MKQFACGALALSLTGAAGFASESETDWSTLDKELEALASSFAQEDGGPEIIGYIRVDYTNSSDPPFQVDSDDELVDRSGFRLRDARVGVQGSRGDWAYKAEYNFADSSLKDAYVRFPIGGQVRGQAGHYKPPLLRSSMVSSSRLFFLDRSPNGDVWSGRDIGFMLFGDFDTVEWWLNAQNGDDGIQDELLVTARVAIHLLGAGISAASPEGSQGLSDEVAATLAFGYFDDGSVEDGDGFAAEFHIGTNVYSFSAEATDIGDVILPRYGGAGGVEGLFVADSTPWSAMFTYMLVPDAWEVGVRYSDFDTDADTNQFEVGINHYVGGHGHKLKVGIFGRSIDSDDEDLDGDLIGVQTVLAF